MLPEILQPFEPGRDGIWDRRLAGHLLRRAGFGGSREEASRVLALGPQKAVDEIFARAASPAPDDFFMAQENLLGTGKEADDLEASWLLRMARDRQPLREKLALFWHGHFATSNAKVQNAAWMLRQHRLFLEKGLGPFEDLLQSISKDAAMLHWLDSENNQKAHPNENYARELMELFSLGIGNYTEKDVQEAARSFTGWEIQDGEFRFNAREHDDGEKTLFGRTARFRGEEVVSVCVERQECASYLAGKLLRFFVLPSPSEEEVAAFAALLREQQLRMDASLALLFRSKLFFSQRAYRSLVKSPVEFAVGSLLATGSKVNLKKLSPRLAELGQRIYHPPSVKGWDGGRAWVHAAALVMRSNLAGSLLGCDERIDARFDPEAFFPHAVEALLDGDAPGEFKNTLVEYARSKKGEAALRKKLQLVMSLPEYQLA